MSIIHSALKKAEKEQNKKEDPIGFSLEGIVATAEMKQRFENRNPETVYKLKLAPVRRSWARVLLGHVLLALTVLSVSGLAFWFFKPAPPPEMVVKVPQSTVPKTIDAPKGFQLTGIVLGKGSRIATVNGKLIQEGDWVGGARVYSIEEASVIMEYNGKKFTLQLH